MKNSAYLLFAIFSFFTSNAYAQDTSSVITNVTRITILNPGISYEMRAGKTSTVYLHAYTTTLSSIGYSSTFGWSTQFQFDPSLSLQYRFYYNIKKRQEKGKRIEKNSLNYIAPVYQMSFSKNALSDGVYVNNSSRRPINEFGVVWGMQRNYASRFSLGINVGPGIFFGKDRIEEPTESYTVNITEFTIVAHLELAIWLGRR